MKFVYTNSVLPKEPELAIRLEKAAETLEAKMLKLNYNALPIGVYAKRYYAYDMRKIRYMLQSYSYLLMWSLHKSGKKPEQISLLDHGAGIGMLSLLAKTAGIKTVLYQDINAEVCNDAKIIAEALGISIDHFIPGDVKDLIQYTKQNNLSVDIFASRNVLEHIYDVDDFMKQLRELPSERLVVFMSTSANVHNPAMRWYTRKLHHNTEIKGAPKVWGGKELDTDKSVWKIRYAIIRENFPALNEEELKKLTTLNRGYIKPEIIKRTEDYILTKQYPVPIKDLTNTCDPLTGNWTERLTPIKEYKKICERNGYEFSYYNGFYNTHYPKAYLNLITPVFNFFIKILGKGGIVLAPFISVCAVRKE